MKWLSFINGIAGILLILVGVSGLLSNHLAAAGVAILGLIVLVLGMSADRPKIRDMWPGPGAERRPPESD